MATHSKFSVSLAALSLIFVAPVFAQSQAAPPDVSQMVRARVQLKSTIDADKAAPGQSFQTTLSDKIKLDDGTVLPAGTKLNGAIAEDEHSAGKTSTLALRFDSATLKDGHTLPIRATIVGFYPNALTDTEGNYAKSGPLQVNRWNSSIMQVDQVGALKNAELHSNVASDDSGTIVFTNKDVKLKAGSEMSLALAAQPAAGGLAQGVVGGR